MPSERVREAREAVEEIVWNGGLLTDEECGKRFDAYAAAVRAEVLEVLESEECAHDLAHTVDDVNPRKTHTGDQKDAAIYCKRIATFLRTRLEETR